MSPSTENLGIVSGFCSTKFEILLKMEEEFSVYTNKKIVEKYL